jgi:predicted ATPase
MQNFVVISGCSGGGKSTLLAELRRRGHGVIEEPGRRIVEEERQSGGSALPWSDPIAFARRAIELAIEDRAACASQDWVFFDRGLIDAAVALEHLTGEKVLDAVGRAHRYNRRVFLTPPWPEIYVVDRERRHSLEDAIQEYERLRAAYPSLGYEVSELPRASVGERADFVCGMLTGHSA